MSKKVNETIVDDQEDQAISRVYEISYILVPTMSETEAEAKAESLKKSIADTGASFISEETPYIRDLAYEMIRVIKNANNRFVTGYFGWVKFELDSQSLEKIEKSLKLDEDIVRFLIVKADRDVNIITKNFQQKRKVEDAEANIDTAATNDVVETVEEVVPAEVLPETTEETVAEVTQ